MKRKTINKIYNFLTFLDSSKVTLILFSEIIFGVFLSVFSFVLFSKITKDVFEQDFSQFDSTIINFVYQFRNPILTKIMLAISFLGGAPFLLFCSLLIILFLIIKKHKHESILFIFTLLLGFAINFFIKIWVGRPRPTIQPLVSEASYSFPSGHSMNSFVFYALIAFYIFRFTRKKRLAFLISTFSILLIFLIGLSRIYLGVHYPSDVVAGFVAGLWWFVTAISVEKTIVFLDLFKQSHRT